jgi:hypothetical protein
MLERELHHRSLVPKGGGYSRELVGWIQGLWLFNAPGMR